MKTLKEIDILLPRDMVLYVKQTCQVKDMSKSNLEAFIKSSSSDFISDEERAEIIDTLSESHLLALYEYEVMRDEVSTELIPEVLQDNVAHWDIIFDTRLLHLELKEEVPYDTIVEEIEKGRIKKYGR